MIFTGVRIRASKPAFQAQWLAKTLGVTAGQNNDNWYCKAPDCRIELEQSAKEYAVPEAPEGYYVGLAHLAFRSTNLKDSVNKCLTEGTKLANGSVINYNPQIWGTGMDYVNPVCPFGYGLEICQRLDLPEESMTGITKGLEHIGIPCKNLAETIAFYERLGFACRTHVLNHRESDGADIDCAMREGNGVILEIYEFLEMNREPWPDPAFKALVFTGKEAQELSGPNGEIIIIRKA